LHDLQPPPAAASAARKSPKLVAALDATAGVAFSEHPSTSGGATAASVTSTGPPPDETQFLAPAQLARHEFE